MAPLSSILLTAGLAMQASAATIQVTVGQNNQLSFSPNEVKAAMGDVVEFHFAGGNHSVVEGDFNNACQPAATNAFFSGYMNALSGPAVSHTFLLPLLSVARRTKWHVKLTSDETAQRLLHHGQHDRPHPVLLLSAVAGAALPVRHGRRHQPVRLEHGGQLRRLGQERPDGHRPRGRVRRRRRPG